MMKSIALIALVVRISLADVQAQTTGGSGPYTAYYFEDATLPNHTIYRPKDNSHLRLPVIAWANGGCSTNGISFATMLGEVASHGAFVISVGSIAGVIGEGTGNVTLDKHPERQKAAIDWVTKVAGTGNYAHVDASKIAVWGQSCGGLESYDNAFDTRVSSIGIFNSGQLSVSESKAVAGRIDKPIFFFLGGPNDVAYPMGERDYSVLPKNTPSWIGNHALGHGGSFGVANAGPAGIAGSKYMQWVLRGNVTAGKWFTDGQALKDGFVDQKSQNLQTINVNPIQTSRHWWRI